ncbi:MAG: alpha/beta hydrolase [Halorhodospira sp.]
MYANLDAAGGGGLAGLEMIHYSGGEGRVEGAPPVLFVHGAFAGAWCWEVHYLPYFAGIGYEAHALSLRGHGGSDGRERLGTASLRDYVEDLATAVAALDQPPVLIGHSMGGLVVDLAVRQGVPAAGVILLAAVPPTGLAPSGMQMMLTEPRLLWQMGVLQGFGPGWVDVEAARRALFAEEMDAESLLEYTSRMQPESQLALFEMSFPRWPRWGGVGCPVAVIGAEADAIIPPWMVQVTAWFHGVQPRWIPDAGHAMMLEPGWQRGAEVVAGALTGMAAAPAVRTRADGWSVR